MNKANLPLVYSLGGLGYYTVLSYSCHRCYSLHSGVGRLNTEVQLLVHSRSVCIRKIHWFRIFFDQRQSPVIPEASENPHTIHIALKWAFSITHSILVIWDPDVAIGEACVHRQISPCKGWHSQFSGFFGGVKFHRPLSSLRWHA